MGGQGGGRGKGGSGEQAPGTLTGKRRRPKKTKEWVLSGVDSSSCDNLSEFEEWLSSESHPLSSLCSVDAAITEEQCICIRKAGRKNARAKHVCGECFRSFKPTRVDGKDLNAK